jgi:hypothetical protein
MSFLIYVTMPAENSQRTAVKRRKDGRALVIGDW